MATESGERVTRKSNVKASATSTLLFCSGLMEEKKQHID